MMQECKTWLKAAWATWKQAKVEALEIRETQLQQRADDLAEQTHNAQESSESN